MTDFNDLGFHFILDSIILYVVFYPHKTGNCSETFIILTSINKVLIRKALSD